MYEDLSEEVHQHLQEKTEDLIAGGMSPEEAARQTRREFGNIVLFEEASREVWAWPIVDSAAADFKYALSQIKRSPGFALTVISILALGIAASTAMFTVVDHVLLRPLPYEHARQLVEIKETGKSGPSIFGAPLRDIEEWRERSHTLQAVAFYINDKPTFFLEGNVGPIQINSPKVSENLFATLGAKPAMGRGFDDLRYQEVENRGEPNTAILSDAVWRDGFGANPDILGKVVKLNGDSYMVVGVMPRGFQFPFNTQKPQVWIPVPLGERDRVRKANSSRDYKTIARLREGISASAAQVELREIHAAVSKKYDDPSERDEVTSVELQAYGDSIVGGNVRQALLALLLASIVLWVIGCVNVTGLLLARAVKRQREIAIRAALGASRWRIVRQLLVEGLLLCGAASLLGLLLVLVALRVFEQALIAHSFLNVQIAPSVPLIGYLFLLTVLAAAFSSIWPALVATDTPIEPVLKQNNSQSRGRYRHRVRGLLVITQAAMSLALLVECGLLLRTLYQMRKVSLGIRTQPVIVADMVIPAYKFDGKNMTTELYQPLVERVEQLPGVEAASLTTAVPLGKRFPVLFSLDVEGQSADAARERDLVAQFRAVGPGLQRVFGFRMLSGRFFTEADTAGAPPVVVVNRAFVKAFLGQDTQPEKILGKELISYGGTRDAQIVGVIDDVRQDSIVRESQPEIEVCIPQITPKSGFYRVTEGLAMNLAVRTDRSLNSFIPDLQEVFRSTSPELAGSTFTTMEQVVEDSYGDQRTAARLLEIFGGSAFLLCIAGLYGLLSYLVTQRTQELGLRFALGAQREDVIRLVMREAVYILAVGSIAGLALSFLSTRVLTSFLYGVAPYDPATFGAASLLLILAGLMAAYIPARRAAGMDPMEALRAE
jgi:predicted permease